jgi:probable F420-dependent oxidoreductase
MRFGTSIPLQTDADPAEEARTAEGLGFDFVSVTDHLPGKDPTFETWTALTWAAASTHRVKLLTNVLGLPYRHPSVLAKMAESLNRLSGGRLILGLGGGGNNEEFRALGLPVRTPREKVDSLSEALDIIKGIWTESPMSYDGGYYELHDALVTPKPGSPIPIWLGSYGPRSLRVLGRKADGWIPSYVFMPPDEAAKRIEIIRRVAKDAGRDPDGLTYAYNVGVKIGEGAASSRAIAGSSEQVAEKINGFFEIGFTVINFWVGQDRREQLERIAKEVIPLLT